MTAWTLFVRTLLRTSAIFIGSALVVLHPPVDWSAAHQAVTAQKSSIESEVDGLIAALADTDDGVRSQAAAALGRIRNARAVPALLRALEDPAAEVRRCAARSLGQIGDRSAVAKLTAALQDPDAKVRRYAARARAALQD